jgi:hypothetical protein
MSCLNRRLSLITVLPARSGAPTGLDFHVSQVKPHLLLRSLRKHGDCHRGCVNSTPFVIRGLALPTMVTRFLGEELGNVFTARAEDKNAGALI